VRTRPNSRPSPNTAAKRRAKTRAAAKASERREARVIGWKLDNNERGKLLASFAPVYANVVADHVTLAAGVAADARPPQDTTGEIVGRADDGAGVEAMVVSIAGTTDRPDGSTYHITWSLAEGRKAVESNEIIARLGWKPLPETIPIRLFGNKLS
jgi:hypothetical protein